MTDARIEQLKTLLPQCLLHDWVRLGWRLARLLRAQHHQEKREALIDRLLEEVHASIALRDQRQLNVPQVSYPTNLPITARKDEIVSAIRDNQVVVIAGETGSGKTTQIPKMCLEAGLGIEAQIGCTQPRRVAALSISRRIAEELNVTWSREVGCKIRFDDRSSQHTYIKLMTDGILLAETQNDPDLSHYNAIIIDEAHERSLNIDFLLGYLKTLLARRKDLKLIVTSATIDTQMFSRHFGDAPIIEVSGRVYPVETIYQPLDSDSEERGEMSYVDAAVQSAERILYESNFGDVLIFMPGERDIRETSDQLEGRFNGEAEIIPLFGRLSSGDQQRVFAPSSRRKVVVATNIAETSLTIPGIRYVIDAGLARISRYNPRTRTKRLPVEPVSQSSANQRKGRAGRVQDGICIRLYPEDDFNARPAFTQPEIQRANLAEVILRMKAFRLGDIETFPFVQPPTPAAIASGYALLQELGALDASRDLTQLGRDLARLPIDPTLGRMLLQSQHEHATHELLIIAAGLSIQDPRERPLDQKDAAAAAHKRFSDPQSDFLSLLNIWNAVHDEWEKLRTQNQRRKFCKQKFLSYLRMREWQDLYAQLHDALQDVFDVDGDRSRPDCSSTRTRGEHQGTKQSATVDAGSATTSAARARLTAPEAGALPYEAIHRSILAGLIGHVGRHEERNSYKTSGNRLVSVFPGSALYARGEPQRKLPKGAKPPPKPKSNQPEWIVAGEIVETSQLFARTIAGIDPQWIYQLAPHCCKVVHQNPRWIVTSGRVLADEVVTLNGLEIQRSKVAYGNINPKQATEIFIRSALVEENLLPRPGNETADDDRDDTRPLVSEKKPELPAQYRFLNHNRAIREKIENWRTRVRRYDLGDLDHAMAAFYAKRLRLTDNTGADARKAASSAIRSPSLPSETGGEGRGEEALISGTDQQPLSPALSPLNRGAREKNSSSLPSEAVGQTFLSAGSGDFPVARSQMADTGLESPVSGVAGKPALQPHCISSVHELNRFLREPGAQDSLCITEAELTGGQALNFDSQAFPDSVSITGQPVQVAYSYAPGEEHDGVTIRLPFSIAQTAPSALIEWAVPGLRAEMISELLRALPKAIRKELMPFPPKVEEIVRDFQPGGTSFLHDLGQFLFRKYGVQVPLSAWPANALPNHLRPRIEVFDDAKRTLGSGRDLPQLKQQLETTKAQSTAKTESHAWSRAAERWERFGITEWNFADPPERVTVSEESGLPVYAWPGLQVEDGSVNLRLFRTPITARDASLIGVQRLVELAIQRDLAWLEKDLRALNRLEPLYAPLGNGEQLREYAFDHLKRFLLPSDPLPLLTKANFQSAVEAARQKLPGLAPQFMDRLEAVLKMFQQVRQRLGAAVVSTAPRAKTLNDLSQLGSATKPTSSNPFAAELNSLVSPDFLKRVSYDRLPHLPRYLKALLTRIERAAMNPVKDQERQRQLAPYQEAFKKLQAQPLRSADAQRELEQLRWMIEEFKVSLFAQELGTAFPVSAKRIDEQLVRVRATP
jgi:HrpA-like RNA helicase